jgi:DNA replication protein DnaC
MSMRYENKKSTIITTNLDYSKWYDLFKQKSLVDAMLDRLKHHCITIHIEGPSLRESEEQDKDKNTQSRRFPY